MIKKKKKHNKIVLLAKSKLDSIEVLISEALIDSYISHNEFVLVNNVLRKYEDMEEEMKNIKTSTDFSFFIKKCYCIVSYRVEV